MRELSPLAPGRHRFTLRVDNRLVHQVGRDSHSVSDHTQGAWNGVIGKLTLSPQPDLLIEAVAVFAEPGTRLIRVTGRVDSSAVDAATQIDDRAVVVQSITLSNNTFEVVLTLEEPLSTWDEFRPNLHTLKLILRDCTSGRSADISTRFGARRLATRGTQLTINGRPTMMRGTLDCCIFPLTGYPPTDLTGWQHVMGTVKAYGLNHVRFHSYCPPEAAFEAADEAGVYLQVECGSWAADDKLGEGKSLDQWLYDEARRIIETYGNHPSFVMLAYGNEPGGDHFKTYLTKWVEHWKQADPRRLHTSGAGWPALPVNDYQSVFHPRIYLWGSGSESRINAHDPETTTDYGRDIQAEPRPIVTHEIGQWCVFPNLSETAKYTGAYRATNFELVRDSLAEKKLTRFAQRFVAASGALQSLCYKEEIESQLRTAGLGGLQLLGLQDFPGQGTALVGVVDAFWDAKSYVSAAQFRRFCNATVVLARLAKLTFTGNESVDADLEIAHYGESSLDDAVLDWMLDDLTHGRVVARGEVGPADVPVGGLTKVGKIHVPLEGVAGAAQLRLTVSLRGQPVANDWHVWVYPRSHAVPPEPLMCTRVDEAFIATTEAGRPILLTPGGKPDKPEVALGVSTIFWNTLWTHKQPPETLGLLCDPTDALLGSFPTQTHSDWQWSEPIRHARCLLLDRLGKPELEPVVRVIDDWNENRSLALLLEVFVGKSRVVISGVDLTGDLADRHASRQLRASILHELTVGREAIGPMLSLDEVRRLIAEPT